MADACGTSTAEPHTVIIGVDPGLDTGVAGVCSHGSHKSNVWNLRLGDHPLRYLHDQLINAITTWKPALLIYEEPVARGMAARSLQRQIGVIILTCELHSIPHYPVNPSTLKKWATGDGRADKDKMLDAAKLKGYSDTVDHNAVDAILLADYGRCVILPTLTEEV